MDILIKNATIVNHDSTQLGDILISGDKIEAIDIYGSASPAMIVPKSARVINAEGYYAMPGFIDTHTHFDLDMGYTKTADDFPSGTRAAILGGTTTVLDFATQSPTGSLQQALDEWRLKARGSSSNYGFHMAIARYDEATSKELPLMTSEGVTSYKMYMVYDALRVDDGSIYAALKDAKREGALVGVHCENFDVLKRITDEVKAEGIYSSIGHALSRPAAVEAEAVARLMRIAELAQAPCYIVHLSTAEGLSEAKRARARGQKVYLETCPQYLLLTDEHYSDTDGEKFVMSPPLRKLNDRIVLWNALSESEIDFIGTDHCSFTLAQKARGKNDFSMTPNGGAGEKYRAELIYTYGVLTGRISLENMVALLSYNASRLFGMEDRGEIAVGKAADIVLYDPSTEQTVSASDGAHNTDNTPFEGMLTKGGARHVILNGELVIEDFELVAPARGRYVFRTPCIPIR